MLLVETRRGRVGMDKIMKKEILYENPQQGSTTNRHVYPNGIIFTYKDKYKYDIPLKSGNYALLFLEINNKNDALSQGECHYFRTGKKCKHGKTDAFEHKSIKRNFHFYTNLIYNRLINEEKKGSKIAHMHFITYINDKETKTIIIIQDTISQIE
jgi:hypothetical protein